MLPKRLVYKQTEKPKYMLTSHHQNAGQNHDIKIANSSVKNMAKFKYLGTTVTNQNLIHEELKSIVISDNASYHAGQNLLSSHLLSKNIKIKIHKIIIIIALYGCETWSLALTEEHSLRVFENRVLRGIFGPRRDEIIGGWRKLHNEELHNFYSTNIIRVIK
jgi:hypothetical protein